MYSRIPLIWQPLYWTGAGFSNTLNYWKLPVLTHIPTVIFFLLLPSQNVHLPVIVILLYKNLNFSIMRQL